MLDGEAGVRRVHRRRVVHAVPQEPDDVPHLLQGEDDPLLLVRIDLDEQVGLLRRPPERLVLEVVERRAISVGGTDGDRLEVVAGLEPGDRVVVSPPEELADGQLVAVR